MYHIKLHFAPLLILLAFPSNKGRGTRFFEGQKPVKKNVLFSICQLLAFKKLIQPNHYSFSMQSVIRGRKGVPEVAMPSADKLPNDLGLGV